eukprot:11209354-Lingulodinium_polyedra.AAC.1
MCDAIAAAVADAFEPLAYADTGTPEADLGEWQCLHASLAGVAEAEEPSGEGSARLLAARWKPDFAG